MLFLFTGDDVCGISITIREKDDIILVWNSDASMNSDGIRHRVHELLPAVHFITEFYKGNNVCIFIKAS